MYIDPFTAPALALALLLSVQVMGIGAWGLAKHKGRR